MPFDRSDIREGMTVYSSDGEKLGKVISCDAGAFVVEKGFFFRKDYIARYDDVRSVHDDDVRIAMSRDAFQDLRIQPEEERRPDRSMLGAEDGAFLPGSFPVAHAGLPDSGALSSGARMQATGEPSAAPREDEVEGGAGAPRVRSEDEDDLARTRPMSEPEEGGVAGVPRDVAHDALTGEWKGRHIGE